VFGEHIHQPVDQRLFGADDDQVDIPVAHESEHRFAVPVIQFDEFGMRSDSRIAGGGIEPVETRRLRQLPGQRMFAAARPEQQDVHGFLSK
ncbi:MAG: hypothetical protein JWM75_2537, partial [Sphingomonas bacterium]|nr:hypothetical protein [Sphingomonas bacterium]